MRVVTLFRQGIFVSTGGSVILSRFGTEGVVSESIDSSYPDEEGVWPFPTGDRETRYRVRTIAAPIRIIGIDKT